METSKVVGIILAIYAVINFVLVVPLLVIFCMRKSLVRSLKFRFPAMQFIAWCCLIIGVFVCGIVCITKSELDGKTIAGVMVSLYGIYVILSCVAPSYRATCHKFNTSKLDKHIQELRNTGVDLHFTITASHVETRTTRDSNGNKHTERRTVVTYTGTRYVPVPFWIDLTKPIVLPNATPYIRIVTKPKVEWCHNSEEIIERIRSHIHKKNAYRDVNVTVTTHVGVPGIISNLIVRSPFIQPTTRQKVLVNPFFGFLLTFFGFGAHHAFMLARALPVVKNKVHKKASLVQPVVDDSWLKQYKIKGAVMTPRGAVFGNVQMVDNWDPSSVPESYSVSQPMFVNPMPLYVTYDTALQYETPTAPPLPYMYMDPNVAQAGFGPTGDAMVAAPTAPPMAEAMAPDMPLVSNQSPMLADPNMQPVPVVDPNVQPVPAVDPNVQPVPVADPNVQPVQPYPGQPGADQLANIPYPGADATTTTTVPM